MARPTAPLPPNSSLVAILLIAKSRTTQSRLVFHYPARPSEIPNIQYNPPASNTCDGAADSSTATDSGSLESYSGTSEDDFDTGGDDTGEESNGSRSAPEGSAKGRRTHGSGSVRSKLGTRSDVVDEEVTPSSENNSDDENGGRLSRPSTGTWKKSGNEGKSSKDGEREWERVLGFPADELGKMLSPTRAFNKKRFEVGIDDIVFLGAPMFVREDGSWKTLKRKKTSSGQAGNGGLSPVLSPGAEAALLHRQETNEGTDLTDQKDAPEPLPSGFEAGYGHSQPASAEASDAGSDAKSTSTNGADGDMTMFNVIFVLNPPALEYHVRIKEMYDNVVKRFAKLLKLSQAQSNYVYKQSKVILSMKEKAKETRTPITALWTSICTRSPLAKAIAHMYEKISVSQIAHVNLNNTFEVSFQIPQAISTMYVPTATEPQMPGLWLTTATLLDEDDTDSIISPHSALLLLEDEDVLIKEIESDAKELSVSLITFIRTLKPTRSLQKLASAPESPLSLRDLQVLARELIFWRRARAIPPLHHYNTYVVSPNADMRNLKNAIPAYQQRFPMQPSLGKMLGYLGGTPKMYSTLHPSKAHREVFMEILAWMMRGGWVMHLRTFAWVRVPVEVKEAVDRQSKEEAEKKDTPSSDTTEDYNDKKEGKKVYTPKPKRDHSQLSFRKSPESTKTDPERTPKPSTTSLLSPQLLARRSPLRTATLERESNSTMSALTAFRPSSLPERPKTPDIPPLSAPTAKDHFAALATPSKVTNDQDEKKGPRFKASIIHSPHKATALESDWLNYIRASFLTNPASSSSGENMQELYDLWPVLIKYFDGKHALDEICLREGIKRKKIAFWLGWLRDGGWLSIVRHW